METTRKWKPLELPTWTAVPAWLLLSGGITVLALWCQPNPLRDVLRIFLEQPVLILLNVLPVALVLAFLGFLTRNLFAGAALTELITGVLSVANRIKIEIREEPVFPRDLALLREVGSAMRNYEIRYPVAAILLVAVPVPEEVQMMVDVYTEGVRDADAMLGRLRDYFAARPEPVVLVFFGDYLPYLGDGGMGYQALGLDVSQVDGAVKDSYFAYETPYVIWANDPAADRLNWTEAAKKLDIGDGESLSAAFLGAAVLELTGRGEETAWFGFLNSLRRSCPVVQRETVLLADGTIEPASDLEGTELGQQLEKWKKWSYYKLRQKILGD